MDSLASSPVTCFAAPVLRTLTLKFISGRLL
jgi:hypothetical protein